MEKTIIVEGKTTNEAIEKGLKELNVTKNMVNIKVIENEEKRSFYSILAPRKVKVELTLKEDIKEEKKESKKQNENMDEIQTAVNNIEIFLKSFLEKEVSYKIDVQEFNINIELLGEKLNYLIGYRGETINALQTIITAIANKNASAKIRVFLDVAGYKNKRVKTLEELAEKISKTVIKTGKSIALEPMTAYERKIIHSKLQSNEKVTTYSKGEEPYRKIVITLK